jgi:hypothetical protein
MTSLSWPAKVGKAAPALAPSVPWQAAQAFDSIAAVGGVAVAVAEMARAPMISANLLQCSVMLDSPLIETATR